MMVTEGRREVAAIEQAGILPPDTVYHSIPVPGGSDADPSRAEWFAQSLKAFAGCDALFLDPDNGLEVSSISIRGGKSRKYALYGEIAE